MHRDHSVSSLRVDVSSSAVGRARKAFFCSAEEDAGTCVGEGEGVGCEDGSGVGKATRLCKTLK